MSCALIAATLIAERADADLRVLTRHDRADGTVFAELLRASGVSITRDPLFVDGSETLDWHANDIALTTSWWTTAALLKSVPPDRVLFLVREDERGLYNVGDEQLRARELLANPSVHMLISTERLARALANDIPDLSERSLSFEPAFPAGLFHPGEDEARLVFAFYARALPGHGRNLFWRGLEAVDRAVSEGVLDLDRWTILFIGSDIPDVELGGRVRPERLEQLGWDEYARAIRSIDLGLSLMASPHPSYPPLDIAACGGVVVTNNWPGKGDLAELSAGIVMSDLDVPSLVQALARGVALAQDRASRQGRHLAARLERDWRAALAPAVSYAVRLWG